MNNTPVNVLVYGTPVPQGSKRHVGRGILVESAAGLKDWRHDVTVAARKEMDRRLPLEGPVSVFLTFSLRRPKSTPRRILHPVTRPDLDKLARGVLDALTAAGVFGDDSQVVELTCGKQYAGSVGALEIPGVEITVAPLTRVEGRGLAA